MDMELSKGMSVPAMVLKNQGFMEYCYSNRKLLY